MAPRRAPRRGFRWLHGCGTYGAMPGNGGVLTVMPNDDGLEGFVTVTVAATDADGLSAEASFEVEVPPAPRPFAPAE